MTSLSYPFLASMKISHYDCNVTVGFTDAVELANFYKREWNSRFLPA